MEEISKNQIIEVLSKIMDLSRGKDIYNSGNVADIAMIPKKGMDCIKAL